VTYRLVYTRRAVKDIEKLDRSVRQRIGKALLRYENDPVKYGEKLTDPAIGSYRFRIGDYRVIFDLEGPDIVVLRVGHRRELYKRM
jgi:mRNA interferase RelE/StbE